MIEDGCGKESQRASCVFHAEYDRIFGERERLFADENACALGVSIGGITVSVRNGTRDANEDHTAFGFSGVIDDIFDRHFGRGDIFFRDTEGKCEFF